MALDIGHPSILSLSSQERRIRHDHECLIPRILNWASQEVANPTMLIPLSRKIVPVRPAMRDTSAPQSEVNVG